MWVGSDLLWWVACGECLAAFTLALLEWVKRPRWAWAGWGWETKWMSAGKQPAPQTAGGLHCMNDPRPDQQNCPTEPDPNADPQNKFIPFLHTDFPGSEDDHYVTPLSSVLSFSTPALLCNLFIWRFHGFQVSLTLTRPLLSGHTPACHFPFEIV